MGALPPAMAMTARPGRSPKMVQRKIAYHHALVAILILLPRMVVSLRSIFSEWFHNS
jgi:hypothetical protein